MWPFKKRKSDAEVAKEWMPRAIGIAAQKWLEFQEQPFVQGMELQERIYLFSKGLEEGLRQWKAFERSPEVLFLVIAAKGVERSGTHLRMQIEAALNVALPRPFEQTDEEQSNELAERIVNRAERMWVNYLDGLDHRANLSLRREIEAFKSYFVEAVCRDYPIEAGGEFFDLMIALGIEKSGTHSLPEIEQALNLKV